MKRLDEVEAQVELEDFMYLESLYNDDEEEDLFDDEVDLSYTPEFDFDADEYEEDEDDE